MLPHPARHPSRVLLLFPSCHCAADWPPRTERARVCPCKSCWFLATHCTVQACGQTDASALDCGRKPDNAGTSHERLTVTTVTACSDSATGKSTGSSTRGSSAAVLCGITEFQMFVTGPHSGSFMVRTKLSARLCTRKQNEDVSY